MAQLIYKICTENDYQIAGKTGSYHGSGVDKRDGFIHFSTAGQVQETAARHFGGHRDLVLLAVDTTKLSPDALRWEPSRGGALFPHLYGDLDMASIVQCYDLPLKDDGTHGFPAVIYEKAEG